MICINDYKYLEVGDEFINKYTTTYHMCKIIKISDGFFKYSTCIHFEFIDGFHTGERDSFEIDSKYSEKCFIFNRNKNLNILLDEE